LMQRNSDDEIHRRDLGRGRKKNWQNAGGVTLQTRVEPDGGPKGGKELERTRGKKP